MGDDLQHSAGRGEVAKKTDRYSQTKRLQGWEVKLKVYAPNINNMSLLHVLAISSNSNLLNSE